MLIQAGRSPQLPCAVGAARLAASRVVRRWAPGGCVGPHEPPARQGPSGRAPQPAHDPAGPGEPGVRQDPRLAQGPLLQGEREAHRARRSPRPGQAPTPGRPALQEFSAPGPSLSAWPTGYHDTPAPSTPVLSSSRIPSQP